MPQTAIWAVDKAIRSAKSTKPTPEELEQLKHDLLQQLDMLIG
jgi:hypothetical protein